MNEEVQDAYRDWLQSIKTQPIPGEIARRQESCEHDWADYPFPFCRKCGVSQDIWIATSNFRLGDRPIRKRFPY